MVAAAWADDAVLADEFVVVVFGAAVAVVAGLAELISYLCIY